jgi:diguanylate cyclase
MALAPDHPQQVALRAFAQMEQRKIPPTPENFTVWYLYCGEINLNLKRALDILISNARDFTAEVCADIYERFCGTHKQGESVRQISERLEGSVTRALEMLANAGAEARQYNEALGESATNLANTAELKQVHEIIKSVMQETQEMLERSDLLERELSKSTAEIGELRKQIEDVSREVMTDALTGLGNRKLFDLRMKQLMAEAMEQGTELCLLMLDIDFFKKFNDTYGHQFGDEVLRLVSKTLIDGIKGRDQAVRYGGEEFGILLPGTRLVDAARVADQLRNSIATKELIKRDTKERLGIVTLSVGVSCYRPGEPSHFFIERADAALYRAKQLGRNRVVPERAPEEGAPSLPTPSGAAAQG